MKGSVEGVDLASVLHFEYMPERMFQRVSSFVVVQVELCTTLGAVPTSLYCEVCGVRPAEATGRPCAFSFLGELAQGLGLASLLP